MRVHRRRICTGVRGSAVLLLNAGWRNDAVHAQVFDHLPIMIVGMSQAKSGSAGAGARLFVLAHHDECILRRNGSDSLVGEGKGILQCLHQLIFGLQGLDLVARHGDGHAEAGKKSIVGANQVLHLAAKSADAGECSSTGWGSEVVFLSWHGFGCADDLVLHLLEKVTIDLRWFDFSASSHVIRLVHTAHLGV